MTDEAQPLYHAHDSVHSCPHVVGCDFANQGVEFGRRGTDAEEKGDFDEDEDETGDSEI